MNTLSKQRTLTIFGTIPDSGHMAISDIVNMSAMFPVEDIENMLGKLFHTSKITVFEDVTNEVIAIIDPIGSHEFHNISKFTDNIASIEKDNNG